jgi:lipopolysaccharide biosynthesis regulator YciM
MYPDLDSIMTFDVQDLLWLLLPLAAASGWYAAYLDQRRKKSLLSDNSLSQDYFRGINHLLNEQPDKAIEVFTQMLEVNTETVETHLALGSLFRRRGEVERAIRIHQNLIARPTLDKAQRSLALCELAQDYHKAGLLDRAENLFLELTEIPAHIEQALRSLMHIYEQEKDWDKAIAVGYRLAKTAARDIEPILAQYHCELGEYELKAGNAARARACAMDALSIDRGCVRASILAGQVASMQGNERDAIRAWQKIEQQDSKYLDEVIDEIAAAFIKLNEEPQLRLYLHDVARRNPGLRTLLSLTELIRLHDGELAAQTFVTEKLRQSPSVPGLKKIVDLQARHDAPVTGENLDLIQDILGQLTTQQEGYQCRQCGFHSQTLHWQCPACHDWITMQPASCSVSLVAPKNTVKPDRAKSTATAGGHK